LQRTLHCSHFSACPVQGRQRSTIANGCAHFDGPVLVRADQRRRGGDAYMPNPALPNFPAGTQVALVRRAMLIAAARDGVTATPLTESIQLRVYREIPDMTAETLEAALVVNTRGERQARTWQSQQEFRLRRADIFAARAGGLHAVASDEGDFHTGFNSEPWDPLERPFGRNGTTASRVRQGAVMGSCFACHSLPGVYSFNSHFNFRIADLRSDTRRRPALLDETSAAIVARSAMKWKEGQPSWTALRGLLGE
jgi:hypothetical protein